MKKKEEWYEITDIDKFVEATRVLIYDSFGKKNYDFNQSVTNIIDLAKADQQELNKTFTQQEALLIVKELAKKRKGLYCINDRIYSKIIESFTERFVGNMISDLTSRGLLESAFDDKVNDFVFWVSEKNENNQKPETD